MKHTIKFKSQWQRRFITLTSAVLLLTQVAFAVDVEVGTETKNPAVGGSITVGSGSETNESGTTITIQGNGGSESSKSASSGTGIYVSSGNAANGVGDLDLRQWINLTYKGGLKEYQRLASKEIDIGGGAVVKNGLLIVDGYIVGTPFVNSGSASAGDKKPVEPEKKPTPEKKPEKEIGKKPEKEPEKKPVEEKKPELTATDTAAIKTVVSNAMKYAVSTREEAKVSGYVTAKQGPEVSEFIKARNEEILRLDANSLDKVGIEAIKKLTPNLIKSDKLKVTEITAVSAEEATAKVTLPLVTKYATMDADLKTKIGKDFDASKAANLGLMISNPIEAKKKMDKTAYESNLEFFRDFHKSAGILDLYTTYPGMFSEGTMTVTVRKESGSWKVDKTSLTINCTIDGKPDSITFLK